MSDSPGGISLPPRRSQAGAQPAAQPAYPPPTPYTPAADTATAAAPPVSAARALSAYTPSGPPLTVGSVTTMMARSDLSGSADIAAKISGTVRAQDMDELGPQLGSLLIKARELDPTTFAQGGFMGLFRRKAQAVKNHFATVEGQVQQLVGEMDVRITSLDARLPQLEALKVQVQQRHQAYGVEIEKLSAQVEYERAHMPVLSDPTDTMLAQQIRDKQAALDLADKFIGDLRIIRQTLEQKLPQIGMMEMNVGGLIQTFKMAKAIMIPELITTFNLYIINQETKKNNEFSEQVRSLNEEASKRNATLLGETVVAVQKNISAPIYSMETLKGNQEKVIKALDDMDRIRGELKARLAGDVPQLEALSRQLSQRMAQAQSSGQIMGPAPTLALPT